jgi:hypothetical protein
MSASGTDKRPRPKRRKRQTSFTIDQEIWDRLKEIERTTFAKPSTIANQILSESLKIAARKEA